jgi:hypothetical protein
MKPRDVLDLSRWEIAHIYFAPRDEHGTLLVVPKQNREEKWSWLTHLAMPKWYHDMIFAPPKVDA